jgi:hypothetical protein
LEIYCFREGLEQALRRMLFLLGIDFGMFQDIDGVRQWLCKICIFLPEV